MKQIASRDNPQFKQLQRLAAHAGRRGTQALLEGVHVCQAWLQLAGPPALAVFDAERAGRPELAALLAAVPQRQVLLVAPRLVRQLESVEEGQGVLYVVIPSAAGLHGRLV